MKRHKTILFLLMSICIGHFTSKAQFGMRASLNLANINTSSAFESIDVYDYKLGVGLGVFYQFKKEKLIIQPELNYIRQGAQSDIELLGDRYKFDLSLPYIQMPIMFKYTLGKPESINYFVQTGPYFGYGIGNPYFEYCLNDNCEKSTTEYDSTGEDGPKPFDFGLQLGGGINLNKSFFIDVRYAIGFISITNDEAEGDVTNKAFNIGIGYLF